MANQITTLHPKGTPSDNLYPNIKSDNIPSGAVTTEKIATGAVRYANLADRAVTHDKIDNNGVHTENILNGAVTTEKILNDAVTTDKILDDAVTTDKIDDGAVTHDKLGTLSVGTENLRDGSVSSEKIGFNIYSHHITLTAGSSMTAHLELINSVEERFNNISELRAYLYLKDRTHVAQAWGQRQGKPILSLSATQTGFTITYLDGITVNTFTLPADSSLRDVVVGLL